MRHQSSSASSNKEPLGRNSHAVEEQQEDEEEAAEKGLLHLLVVAASEEAEKKRISPQFSSPAVPPAEAPPAFLVSYETAYHLLATHHLYPLLPLTPPPPPFPPSQLPSLPPPPSPTPTVPTIWAPVSEFSMHQTAWGRQEQSSSEAVGCLFTLALQVSQLALTGQLRDLLPSEEAQLLQYVTWLSQLIANVVRQPGPERNPPT
jgi:hypothetical protein